MQISVANNRKNLGRKAIVLFDIMRNLLKAVFVKRVFIVKNEGAERFCSVSREIR